MQTNHASQNKVTENIVSSTIDFQILKQFEKNMGHEIVLTLIEQFLDYAPEQLMTLQQNLAIRNSEALRAQAHQFKGECLQIGANQLGDLCGQLEIMAEEGQLETASANITQIEKEWSKVKMALTHQENHNDK